MKTNSHLSSGAGFTLVELEVVVVILVVLVMLVLPGLAGIKRAGQQVQCLNNLRQLGAADLVYVADHGLFIEPSQSKYWGNNSEWMGVMMDSASVNTNALLCPTASKPPPPYVLSEYGGLQEGAGSTSQTGTSDGSYFRGQQSGGTSGFTSIWASYGCNGWLYIFNGRGEGDGQTFEGRNGYPADPSLFYTNEASMAMPANTPLFFDGVWCDAWPLETDSPAKNLYTGILGENNGGHLGYEMGRLTFTRHGINPETSEINHAQNWNTSPPVGSINMVFGDGHAQVVKVGLNLWQLNWHRGWGSFSGEPISPGNPQ